MSLVSPANLYSRYLAAYGVIQNFGGVTHTRQRTLVRVCVLCNSMLLGKTVQAKANQNLKKKDQILNWEIQ
jgi:hypothetical protein